MLFLDIAIPEGMSQADILKRYDSNYGFPTAAMVEEMKDACQKIANMKTYEDWFQVKIYNNLLQKARLLK